MGSGWRRACATRPSTARTRRRAGERTAPASGVKARRCGRGGADGSRVWVGERCEASRSELFTAGGEVGFVSRLISESAGTLTRTPPVLPPCPTIVCVRRRSSDLTLGMRDAAGWFSSLVGRKASLSPLLQRLDEAGAVHVRTTELAQGQRSDLQRPPIHRAVSVSRDCDRHHFAMGPRVVLRAVGGAARAGASRSRLAWQGRRWRCAMTTVLVAAAATWATRRLPATAGKARAAGGGSASMGKVRGRGERARSQAVGRGERRLRG